MCNEWKKNNSNTSKQHQKLRTKQASSLTAENKSKNKFQTMPSCVWPSSCFGKTYRKIHMYTLSLAKLYKHSLSSSSTETLQIYIYLVRKNRTSEAKECESDTQRENETHREIHSGWYICYICIHICDTTDLHSHGHMFEAQQFVLVVCAGRWLDHDDFNMYYHFWGRSWLRRK